MNMQPPDTAATESLLAFWRDAGVDACFEEAAVDRTHVQPPPALKAVARATAAVVARPDTDAARTEARHLAAAAETMDALATAIAGFDGCPLSGMGASQSVFARGDPAAPVLIIGEGPGTEEDAQGMPFVGPAGRLLDRMLAAADLTDRVFITNTVYWKPPGNRSATPQEQAVCAPFVDRVCDLLRPKVVLLVGAAAVRSVLGNDEGIMRLRGQWKEWHLPEGGFVVPVMPTLHPAFLLRQPQAKRQVWADLLALTALLDGTASAG